MRAGKIEGVTTPNQNQGTSPWYFCCIFISHFYRAYKFYFFSLKFSYEHSEIPTNFCFLDLLHFQNNECKKNLEIREGSQEQWKHTSTPYIFFFLSLVFSYEHAERFPAFFLCLLSISRIMNAKKKLEIREGSQEQWKHTSTPYNFFFSFTRLFLWALRKIPYYFFPCAVSICTVLKAKKSPNEQYFVGFSWKFPDFRHWHQIFASTKF